MIEVLAGGLQTIVVDWPGRLGYWDLAIPPGGPMDSLAFRLANRLVGNDPGAAGLEIQYLGPEIRFHDRRIIALTGATVGATINGQPATMWRTIEVEVGDVLRVGSCLDAARTYLAVSGAIDVQPWLGSRSTFLKGRVGGFHGRALAPQDRLALGNVPGAAAAERWIRDDRIPRYAAERVVEVIRGPHDDWLADEGIERFLAADWEILSASDRTGYRLKGPEFIFSRKAYDKAPENGDHPSNIIDFGYSVGSVNLSGQTPIVLPVDGPSLGGFICPFTVCWPAMWKLGQKRPGDSVRMRVVSLDEADDLTAELDRRAGSASVVSAS
jgi:biotin-dependent carboxylase-like uncharacterized protein